MKINRNYIGVVGANGAGKSTFCSFLMQRGYDVMSLSDVVRDILRSEKASLDRDSLTQRANGLKEEFGLDYFAKMCFEKAGQKSGVQVVFDSVRHPAEMAYLRQQGVFFVGLKVSLELRYKRIVARQRETDFIDLATFKLQDERERSGASSGQSIDQCLETCDVILENTGDLGVFHQDIASQVFCEGSL